MESAKILIVDDESDHRFLLAAALQECSPEDRVVMAEGAQEAIDILSKDDFDAILCDFSLGTSNGLEILKTLRKGGREIPFLLVTNHGSEEVARQAFLAGVTDYVTKEAAFRNPADLSRKMRRAVERRRLEREKHKAEAILESFLENNPYAILILSPNGRIVRWNRALAGIRGLPEDMEGLLARYNPFDDPQLKDAGLAPFIEEARSGRWVKLPPFVWDPQKLGIEGEPRIFRGVAFPIVVEGEPAPHLCAMIQDVTEEERARRERDEYAAIVGRLLDARDAAILFVTADQRVRFANRRVADFFGIQPAGIVGKSMPELVEEISHSTGNPEAFLLRSRALWEDPARESEEDVELLTPARRHLRRQSGPVRDGGGRLLGRIEVYTDQTEAVERTKLLEAQNRELDAFASRLAHDLKTPLVSLKGFVDLLHRQHGQSLDERGSLYLEKVRSSAAILSEMVDGLRELAHSSEEGTVSGSLDPVPIFRLVADALAPEAAERGVEIALPQTTPLIQCDRAKLFQMFQNLLSNAIRHSDATKLRRWVLVETEERGREIEIRVSDNGGGLDPDELPEIFRPFRRGRRSAGRPGMGLGLAITQRVAQVCNGRVEVRSRPGEGSTFSLFLPQAK